MNYLITGGAGFIGSHLTEALVKQGHNVTVFDDFNDYYDPAIKRKNLSSVCDQITLIEGDIRDAALVERTFTKGNFDTIIHLAARAGVRPSIKDPKLYVTTNIEGTFNLLDACRYHDVKHFIFTSSSSVYGLNQKVPFCETDAINQTISPYAATKLSSEQICSNYSHLFGIRTMCLRLFTVYGPRQRPDLAIAGFIEKILNNQPIDHYGNGSTARDYTYIDDIIQGILAAIAYDKTPFEIFNLGGSVTTQLSELIFAIEEALGKKAQINTLPEQSGDVPLTYSDISKSQHLLGYNPKTTVSEGLNHYIDWLKKS